MNYSKQAIYIVYYQWLKIIAMSTGMVIPKQMGCGNSRVNLVSETGFYSLHK